MIDRKRWRDPFNRLEKVVRGNDRGQAAVRTQYFFFSFSYHCCALSSEWRLCLISYE